MIDPTKPYPSRIDPLGSYTTRDGRPVRILCTDSHGSKCVIGIVNPGPLELINTWTIEGRRYEDGPSDSDLIPAPVRHQLKRWVNVYRDDDGTVRTDGSLYSVRDGADSQADSDLHHGRLAGTERIACLPITLDFCEGEGL